MTTTTMAALTDPTEILTGLTIQQLRCFIEVADTGQFTLAAANLHLAQPSLSGHISRLEVTLGIPLFHRDHRPVTLTGAGAELLPLARRALNATLDVMRGAADVDSLSRGRVTLGATPTLAATLLPQVLAAYRAAHPGVTLFVDEKGSHDLAADLEAGVLDLALVILPLRPPGLIAQPLATEELVILVAPGHPLAAHPSLVLTDLLDVPMILLAEGYDLRSSIVDLFAQRGQVLTVALDGAEIASLPAYVAAGLGAALVPDVLAAAHPELVALRFTDPVVTRQIGLAHPAATSLSRAAGALADLLSAHLIDRRWPVTLHS